MRAAFSDVRRKLLPEIAARRYTEAKALFDRKDYAAAAQHFRQVVGLLDDPDMGGKLPDLRTLVSGFLDLSVAASTPPPEPPKPAAAAPPAPVVPQPEPNRVYSMTDPDVTPPVVIRQQMPALTPAVKQQAKERGVVEVLIDEQGRVIHVAVRMSVHPIYDADLLSAGRDWRYQPATYRGKPVRYRKMIQINLAK